MAMGSGYCTLCKIRKRADPVRHHPLLPMDNMRICAVCDEHLRNKCRYFSHSSISSTPTDADHLFPTSSNTSDSSAAGEVAPAAPSGGVLPPYRRAHIARLVVFVELLAWGTRDDPSCERLRDILRSDSCSGLYCSPKDLGVDRLLVVVAATVLRTAGVKLSNGHLSIPMDAITLPEDKEARSAVEYALSRDGLHLDVGSVWNPMFHAYPWSASISAHTVFECLFAMLGIKLAAEKRVRASRRRQTAPTITLDRDSVAHLLEDASKHAPPAICTAIKLLEAPPHNPEVKREAAIAKKSFSVSNLPKNTCVCCLNTGHEATFPFHLVTCKGCTRLLCSICLERVFGCLELSNAFRNKTAFRCVICRVNQANDAATESCTPLFKNRKRRLEQNFNRHIERVKMGGQPQPKRRKLQLLTFSTSFAASILRIPYENDVLPETPIPEDIGFAKTCEDINLVEFNENSVTKPGNKVREHKSTVCLECSLPLCTPPNSGTTDFITRCYSDKGKSEGLRMCSRGGCNVVVHEECARGGDANWQCRRHRCAKCRGPCVSHCRTCTRSYCEPCRPDGSSVHLYSPEWISCPECRPKLGAPRPISGLASISVSSTTTSSGAGSSSEGYTRAPNDYDVLDKFNQQRSLNFVNNMSAVHRDVDTRDLTEMREKVDQVCSEHLPESGRPSNNPIGDEIEFADVLN